MASNSMTKLYSICSVSGMAIEFLLLRMQSFWDHMYTTSYSAHVLITYYVPDTLLGIQICIQHTLYPGETRILVREEKT